MKPQLPQYWSQELGWSQISTRKSACGKGRLWTGKSCLGSRWNLA